MCKYELLTSRLSKVIVTRPKLYTTIDASRVVNNFSCRPPLNTVRLNSFVGCGSANGASNFCDPCYLHIITGNQYLVLAATLCYCLLMNFCLIQECKWNKITTLISFCTVSVHSKRVTFGILGAWPPCSAPLPQSANVQPVIRLPRVLLLQVESKSLTINGCKGAPR